MGGICGGIAEFFRVDSTLVRLGAVFLCFITGVVPLVFVYFIGWIIIPEKKRDF